MAGESKIIAGREEAKYYPYTGIFKWARETFWQAGQDSYTAPPAQDPDLFLQLTNVEPVTRGILQRRRGYTLFSSQAPAVPFIRSFAFRSEALSLRRLIWTSPSTVLATDETGVNVLNPIFTPAPSARAPRMVLSRDFGYFADGQRSDSLKWNGTINPGNLTNWGIDINSATAVGPTNPAGTAVDLGDRTSSWTNVTNVQGAPDGVVATALINSGSKTTNTIQVTNYGFAISALSTIVGIQVNITWKTSARGLVPIAPIAFARLVKNGTPVGTSLSNPGGGSLSLTAQPIGGSNQLWGATWLPADINNANFGVDVYFSPPPNGLSATISVDAITITIFFAAGPVVVGAPGVGSINLISGRTYFYVGQNSNTGATSSLPFASLTTGPLTNNNVPISSIGVFTDIQVDTVLILATADGNDETTLFLIGSVPNGTTTFTDNMPDTVLLTQPVYQETDTIGQLHGVANNNPPPLADFPTKHKGRLYLAQGHNLYFSKSLDDVTTSTGSITGKWEEAWPFVNVIDLSEFDQTIRALLSDGETLWIGTERDIGRLIGDGPLNFQKPEIQFNECGVLNPEVWKVVFFEGQPIGTMWMTPDFRVIASDFNTYKDVGTSVQDVLNSINPAAAQNCHAQFVNKQAFDLYILYIPTGSNTVPDTALVYNLRTQKWSVWLPTDQISTSLFNIDVNGNTQWLFGANAGPLYFWDSTVLQDRNGNTPVSYPVTIQTTWQDCGDYTWWKVLNLQILTSDDNALTLAIDGAVTNTDFLNPTQVLPPTVVTPSELRAYLQLPLTTTQARHYWFRFTWVSPASTIQNVLTSVHTEIVPFSRF